MVPGLPLEIAPLHPDPVVLLAVKDGRGVEVQGTA
jgi:hypothetical protein